MTNVSLPRTSASWSLAQIATLSGGQLDVAHDDERQGDQTEVDDRQGNRTEVDDRQGNRTEVDGREGNQTEVDDPSSDLRVRYGSISTDTRTLHVGDLFVALRGENHDGHDHLTSAIDRGACALFLDQEPSGEDAVERGGADAGERVEPGAGEREASCAGEREASGESGRVDSAASERVDPGASRALPWIRVADTLDGWQRWGAGHRAEWKSGPLVAVTGSSGKTTTKNALAHLLAGLGPVWATPGNRNNHIGVPWTLLGLGEEHRFAVVEMGMNAPGEIRTLSRLAKPDVALITSVGRAHIGRLGSREAILAAKLEITEGLSPDGVVVLPQDPWVLERLPKELASRQCLTFGLTPEADWCPSDDPVYTATGTRLRTKQTGDLELPLLGAGPVLSVLAALAVVDALGLDVRALAPRLAELRPEPMRMEPRTFGSVTVIADCYNASPESTRLAIDFLGSVRHDGRRVLVLGELSELGDETEAIHRELVRGIQNIDLVLLIGSALAEVAEEAEHYPGAGHVVWRALREDASTWLAETLEAGDLVLLKASRRLALERILEGPAPGPLTREED